MTELDAIPFRIRIGVTGHRALPNEARLREQLRHVLKEVTPGLLPPEARRKAERIRTRGQTPIAYSVVTPLAEGADRLVAEVALEIPGTRLEAVLPLEIDDYRQDFQAPGSREKFDRLLGRCPRPIVVSRMTARSGQSEPNREEAYAAAGKYVVDHCDELIALWDRAPARGIGGTAEIVTYARKKERPIVFLWGDGPAQPNWVTA